MINLKYKLILGSASPRRIELLNSIGIFPEVKKPNILEQIKPNETPVEYVKRNSLEKALSLAHGLEHSAPLVILSADTIVVHNNNVLEKPIDSNDAIRMLEDLSNNTHQVFTGYCILLLDKNNVHNLDPMQDVVQTLVTFRPISTQEILAYIATQEPMDKAGSYGAQGYGACFIKSIQGSHSNVVGLPLCEITLKLQELNQYV